MTEFTKNINNSAEIEHSLFFINFGYKLRIEFDIIKMSDPQSIQKRID